ncbi:hypothetical protein [Paenibacillus sp. NEAU-GSW1]|uniref:hypothetical protein n=1 Tax=Paenibacillus sp. NEAU-GSW1 TaxID=2682486 RepID=UPI0012E12772|nr:hypothetical protein [Paenibacillus sp. NEAU-GSW1]MUT65025.1 hypothetical protein [Paenibacillus sp. NEAU-GSW1]
MALILFVVVGCYALVAALVHLIFWLRRDRVQVSKHYVLVAHNQHMRMEWLLRSFFSFSRRTGTEVKLTVVDAGSTDQTVGIVDRLERGGGYVSVHAGDQGEGSMSDSSWKDRKRSQSGEKESSSLLWRLKSEGIVTSTDHAILVDLQNPSDLSKMPF